jgi:hypothetical protein
MSIGDQKTRGPVRFGGSALGSTGLVQERHRVAREILFALSKLVAYFCTFAFWLPMRLVSLRLPVPRQYGASHR